MAKTIRRAIAILLAATAIIILLLPATNVSATYTKGDYVIDGGTLVSYTGTESDITIPLGITTIGKDAFSGNNTLTKVYIPDEVTSIDYASFENCKNLEKVVIGDGVKSIGSAAFSGCQSLKEINIPKYTDTIGSGSFAACPNLTDIKIDEKNRDFICLDGVLYSKDGKTLYQYLAGRPYSTYDIPKPVTEIMEFGFYGANMLTNVKVVSGVEEISEYCFLNCTALNNVSLPGTIKAIRKGAFGGCTNLTKLNVPTSCGLIDEEAFSTMDGIKGDVVNEATGEVLSVSNETGDNTKPSTDTSSETDSDSTENLSDNSDENTDGNTVENSANNSDETIDEGNSNEPKESYTQSGELAETTIVGGQAVFLLNPKDMNVKGFDLASAQTEDSIADSGNTSSEGEDIRGYSGKEFDVIDGILGHYGGNNSSVSIPESVNKIGNRVFYKNNIINNVSIPSSVNEIGDFAFARSKLTSVDIPSSVEKIGYAAFYNCNNLSNVNIPSTVKTIELGAFDNTAFINNWRSIEDGNNFLVLGDGILVAYKGHTSDVVIPDMVKTIGPAVFEGDTHIKSVIIPENCVKISEDAFNGCRRLSEVTLPKNLTTIEDRAFKDTSLSYVQIPSTVKEIGLGAFDTVNVNGGMQSVTFMGSFLPDLTYKPTATRLSANNLRTNAFNGVNYAIVPQGVNMGSGTIFDADQYGFRGEVYSYSDSSGENNYVQLRKCTKEPDEAGIVTVNPEIEINGNNYYLEGVSDTAFDAYKDSSWCKNKLTLISLNGNNSNELDNLLNDINFAKGEGSNEDIGTYEDAIHVSVPDNSMNSLYVDAVLPNANEKFNLTINKNQSLRSDFEKAFDNRFGTHSGVLMDTYDIEMTERLKSVPIKKMATGKLNISLPVPSEFSEAESLQIATLDDNGLLEEVACNISNRGDGTKIMSFVASHLSPFAIYTSENILYNNVNGEIDANIEGEIHTDTVTVENVESLSESSDNTLNTSIVYNTLQKKSAFGIPGKTYIAGIMLLISAFLFLYKKKAK